MVDVIFDEDQLNREQAEDEMLINLVDQIVTRNRAERYVKRLFNDAARIQHADVESCCATQKLVKQYRNRIQAVINFIRSGAAGEQCTHNLITMINDVGCKMYTNRRMIILANKPESFNSMEPMDIARIFTDPKSLYSSRMPFVVIHADDSGDFIRSYFDVSFAANDLANMVANYLAHHPEYACEYRDRL